MTLSFVETEEQLHLHVAAYLDQMLPFCTIWHHSPNEGSRHVSYKLKQKRMGTKPGWPDIEIFAPAEDTWAEKPLAIFIELKRSRPKTYQSKSQKLIEQQLLSAGCEYRVCRSLEEVDEFLQNKLILRGKLG